MRFQQLSEPAFRLYACLAQTTLFLAHKMRAEDQDSCESADDRNSSGQTDPADRIIEANCPSRGHCLPRIERVDDRRCVKIVMNRTEETCRRGSYNGEPEWRQSLGGPMSRD
jgi:hypothetical protein